MSNQDKLLSEADNKIELFPRLVASFVAATAVVAFAADGMQWIEDEDKVRQADLSKKCTAVIVR